MTDYDDLDETADFDSGRSPELDERIVAASWAVAARDCAIEVGDLFAAADFADQARAAIDRAAAAGIEPAELAAELDYPGGHLAMDGPHIDDEIVALLPPEVTDQPVRADLSPSPAGGLAAAAAVTVDDEATDTARAEQLGRWHHDDRHSTEANQARADGWA